MWTIKFTWLLQFKDKFAAAEEEASKSFADLKYLRNLRSSRPELFYIKSVLKLSQNLQENTCSRVSLLIETEARTPVNLAKCLRTPSLQHGTILVPRLQK